MSLASLVDVDALWHVALYSSVAVVGIVTAYGGAVVALDRAGRPGTSSAVRAGWLVALGLAGAVCLGLLGVGLWAMMQK